MTHSLEDIYKLIQQGNNELKQEIKNIKDTLTTEIQNLKLVNEELELENKEIKQRLLETERKLKKYNFVIYGVGGNEEHTAQNLVQIVNEILNVKCDESDFRDIFRIGKHVTGKVRPVIAEAARYNLKATVLSSARDKIEVLKKHNIFFSHDFVKEDYTRRKYMHQKLQLLRKENPQAIIKNNVIIMNGSEYTYEKLKKNDDEHEQKEEELSQSQKNQSISTVKDKGKTKEESGQPNSRTRLRSTRTGK